VKIETVLIILFALGVAAPLTILHLSDPHDRLSRLDVDFVFVTGDPNRHDLRYNYELILYTYVNSLHDGIFGRFNYYRNLYGVELKFRYSGSPSTGWKFPHGYI
jgi:hypothetical protein